jgi:hypothetical protein
MLRCCAGAACDCVTVLVAPTGALLAAGGLLELGSGSRLILVLVVLVAAWECIMLKPLRAHAVQLSTS